MEKVIKHYEQYFGNNIYIYRCIEKYLKVHALKCSQERFFDGMGCFYFLLVFSSFFNVQVFASVIIKSY